jgi:hypothetical protein
MERSGRSRGNVFRRGAIGAVLLPALAGCGSGATNSAAQPSFAQSVSLRPVSGTVRVAIGPGGFVSLRTERVVPVGTIVDTSAGAVALTSATAPPTRLQTGQFHGGVFEVRQSSSERGLTNLVIRDRVSRRKACGAPRAGLTRILGLLRGSATGRFRTTGRFAAGTVRGTEWGVRDRCDGTLVVVTRGAVTVRDFRLGREIVVRAGHTYLATAP